MEDVPTANSSSGNSFELKLLKQLREKLNVALTFEMTWLAQQMEIKGLLSESDYKIIINPRTWMEESDKSSIMVESLIKKVTLENNNLNVFENILTSKPDKFKEILQDLREHKSTIESEVHVLPPADASTDGLSSSNGVPMATFRPIAEADACKSTSSEVAEPPPSKRINLGDSYQTRSVLQKKKPTESDAHKTEGFPVALKPGQVIRKYQLELAEPGLHGKNYIFVAPTGSGKTLVSATVIARHLGTKPNSRVAFVVPTKPLADQQMSRLKEYIPDARVNVYTGGELAETEPYDISDSNDHIAVCTAGKLYEEIRQKRVNFSHFSLLVLDECHHTVKEHVYAKLMKLYLEDRQSLSDFQIIGMTASLGAGGRSNISDHMKTLQAHLDATGGIMSVRNPSDLGKFNREPSRTLEVLQPRDIADEFISEVVTSMKELEDFVKMFQDCDYDRWSQEYETFVIKRKEALEASTNAEFRDQISTLNELLKYCTALSVYMDFSKMDAIRIMKGTPDISDNENATVHEKNLQLKKAELLANLQEFQVIENPLLLGIERILKQKFECNESSRAIIFVRTKNHTVAMKKWLARRKGLGEMGIFPDLITGYTGRGDEMNRERQAEVLKKFSEGSINVLVATSVAEEGLDIPDCNLVIRYQHVSSEIAKIQAEGRARANDSDCYTVLSTSSNFRSQEVKNQALILQVVRFIDSAMQAEEDEIRKLQNKIVNEERARKTLQEKIKIHAASSVTLLCKKCKKEVCSGEDIRLLSEDEAHHVIPEEKMRQPFIPQPHNKPIWISRSLFLTRMMMCAGCRNKWGHIGYSSTSMASYCLLSCRGFTFAIVGNSPHLGRKWSEVPFHILSTP